MKNIEKEKEKEKEKTKEMGMASTERKSDFNFVDFHELYHTNGE